MRAREVDSLYVLDVGNDIYANSVAKSVDMHLMHKRYGHISKSLIAQTLKHDSVLNAGRVNDNEFFCKSCAIDKSRKLPHSSFRMIRN